MFKYLSKKLNKKNRGFTLVELIVVIAILAILAAIAVPQMLGFQERARQTADQQTAAQVKNAVGLLWANKEVVLTDATADSFVINGTTGVVTYTGANITSPTEADMTTTLASLVANLTPLRNADRDIFVGISSTGQVRAEVVNSGVDPSDSDVVTWLAQEAE